MQNDPLFRSVMDVSPLYVFGDDGLPVAASSLGQWVEFMDTVKPLGYTIAGEWWKVSTIFLGTGFSPMLFETMVWLDGRYYSSRRYADYTEAMRGHEEHVEHMKVWFGEPPPDALSKSRLKREAIQKRARDDARIEEGVIEVE